MNFIWIPKGEPQLPHSPLIHIETAVYLAVNPMKPYEAMSFGLVAMGRKDSSDNTEGK